MNPNQALIPSIKEIPVELVTGVVSQIPAAPLDERAKAICAYHKNGKRAAFQLVAYNLLAGLQLIAAKIECGHGAWLKWCKQNLPDEISERSANRYMALAGRMIPELTEASGDLIPKLLQAGCNLAEQDLQRFQTIVAKTSDGRGWKELLIEYGVERPPEPKKFSPPKLTPAEQEEARTADALALCNQLIGLLDTWHDDHDARARVPAAQRKLLIESCVRVSGAERAWLKKQKPEAKKKSASSAKSAVQKSGKGK